MSAARSTSTLPLSPPPEPKNATPTDSSQPPLVLSPPRPCGSLKPSPSGSHFELLTLKISILFEGGLPLGPGGLPPPNATQSEPKEAAHMAPRGTLRLYTRWSAGSTGRAAAAAPSAVAPSIATVARPSIPYPSLPPSLARCLHFVETAASVAGGPAPTRPPALVVVTGPARAGMGIALTA